MTKIDLLFKNANVLTLDKKNHHAGSVGVANGKIVGIWEEAEPSADEVEFSPQTNVVDLKGATLIPGFIETHNHILLYATFIKDMLNCKTPPNKSIKDIQDLIGAKANITPDGEWILGFGYDDTLLSDNRHVTRADLDEVAPNNPVFLMHACGHYAAVNSLALEAAGVTEAVIDPPGGHYGRDEKGRLNGVLQELDTMRVIDAVLPKKSIDEMVKDVHEASKHYVAHGITTSTEAMVQNMEELAVHLKVAEQGLNPLRTQVMILHNYFRKGEIFGDYTPDQLRQELKEKSGNLVKFDSVKMFQDGSIQGLTGALHDPYYAYPEITGELINSQEAFNEEISEVHNRGFRIAIHGNGDRAIESILEAYEYAQSKNPRSDHRHRVEHLQAATTQNFKKMKELGIAASFFNSHVYYWGDRHERLFLGPERGRRISPLADAVEHNILFGLHSDFPFTPISPLFYIWAAVTRQTSEGRTLGPEQCIDVVTALKSMTINGAELNFDEDVSGSIEIGKYADFAVLEADPTTVDPMEIKDIQVLATYIDGKAVYGHETILNS